MPASTSTESVVKTVANKNTVKIALDEYNDLLVKAARPVVNNVTVLRKTTQQAAEDNIILGWSAIVIGVVIAGAGAAIRAHGKKMHS